MEKKNNQKILLVDDNPNIIDLYSSVFLEYGFKFSTAKNGREAIEKAEAEKPSLILLDIMLPDLNGFDVLKTLKENPSTESLTVWVLSVLAEQANLDRARSLGADDYLVKSSYTPAQICEKIQKFFTRAEEL